MDESESTPAGDTPAAGVTAAGAPPFQRTRLGAAVFGLGAAAVWMVFGMCAPGFVIGVVLAISKRNAGAVQFDEQGMMDAVAPWVPWIVAWSAVTACVVALVLRATGRLAPGPAAAANPRAGRIVIGTALATVGALVLQFAVAKAQNAAGVRMEEQPIIEAALRSGGAGVALALVLFGPLGEEILFRRVVYRTLSDGWGRGVAACVSVLIFALVHMHAPALLGYVVIGAMCTFAYEYTGQLGAAVFVHAANNLAAVMLHES